VGATRKKKKGSTLDEIYADWKSKVICSPFWTADEGI
jgi:hypothetical protein